MRVFSGLRLWQVIRSSFIFFKILTKIFLGVRKIEIKMTMVLVTKKSRYQVSMSKGKQDLIWTSTEIGFKAKIGTWNKDHFLSINVTIQNKDIMVTDFCAWITE